MGKHAAGGGEISKGRREGSKGKPRGRNEVRCENVRIVLVPRCWWKVRAGFGQGRISEIEIVQHLGALGPD